MSNRKRNETIGPLGRVAARKSSVAPPPQAPPPKKKETRATQSNKALEPQPKSFSLAAFVRSALFDNLAEKALAMILAVTVFLLVNIDRDGEIMAQVGVSYSLPSDKVLVSERIDSVRVIIRGPSRKLKRFHERELERLNIDLRSYNGSEFAITKDLISLPNGLVVTDISPRTVKVAFEPQLERQVSVVPNIEAANGFSLSNVTVEPTSVTVRGPQRLIRSLTSIRTRELKLDTNSATLRTRLDLVAPEGVELVNTTSVAVSVKVDEKLVSEALHDVPLVIESDDGNEAKLKLSVSKVEVSLTGPVLDIALAKSSLVAKVRALAGDLSKAREAEVVIEGVPLGLGVKVKPDRVRISPKK